MEKQPKDKRKLLLMLPLLVLPFLALGFYALGGGKGETVGQTVTTKGINAELPDASFKQADPTDKLGYYQQADRDSAGKGGGEVASLAGKLGFTPQTEDPQTQAINQRIAVLNKEISKPETATPSKANGYYAQLSGGSSDVDRLETLMKNMQEKKGEDPEMKQLSNMLDKIISIQNPGTNKTATTPDEHGRDSAFQAIPVLINGNQKVAPGAAVSLVLRDSVHLNGILLPKGQKLSGLCTVTNQRLLLEIRNIRLGTSIIPVSLTVYSLDGLQGIPAPEADLSEATGNGVNNALSGMQFLSADQSLATQAASAGISAATGLLGKKVKKIRVKLHGGQMLLLRNNKS